MLAATTRAPCRLASPLWPAFGGARRALRTSTSTAASREVYSVPEVKDLLDKGYKYLDVRTTQEFAMGHAPGATNVPVFNAGPGGMVPNTKFLSAVQAVFPDPETPLVVGCQAGNRSTTAISLLQDAYVDLVNAKPGYSGWVAAGQPVTK